MRLALSPGEEVLLDLRPHWRRLTLAVVLVPVVVGGAAYGAAAVPSGPWLLAARIAILGAALLLLTVGALRPWLRWRGTRLLVTNRRVVARYGVLSRRGRDVPLARVSDVSYQQRLAERLWRSGTLVVESTGEGGQLVVADVPAIEDVHSILVGLLSEQPVSR